MNLSDLQRHLRQLDLQPSRKLGQNFLVNGNLSAWIARQIDPGPEDAIVEIGPGFGALTEHLAGRVRRLVLVEKDGRLAEFLRERHGGAAGVEVVHGDATDFDPRPLFREGPVKFLGNLPYSAGNEILRRFLDAPSPVGLAVAMVQREVADRICSAPGSKSYGVLGLLLQRTWMTSRIKTVGPELFHPRPEIDSTVVRFEPRPVDGSPGSLPPHSPEVFASVVKRGFSQRRKQLRKNLRADPGEWEEICAALDLAPTVRAEELDLAQWAELSNRIAPHPCSLLPPSDGEALEVVGPDDRVVETRPRAEIHRRGLRHRAVHVFVLDKKGGEIYLQKRSVLKDTHPGRWDSSASGHVDPGERYEDCARRELEEELWAEPVDGLRRVLRFSASGETDQEFIEVFEARAAGGIRVHGREVECGRFFRIGEVEQWIAERPEDFATGFRTCFRAWREKKG